MPYCYAGDPITAHGKRHHVFLNVDYDAHDEECVCGESTILTYALTSLQDAEGDHETAREWFDTADVNEECADEARKLLGLTRDLTEIKEVTPRRAHILHETGLGSHYDLRTTPARIISATTGLPRGAVEVIHAEAGGRYPNYNEEWEVIPEL